MEKIHVVIATFVAIAAVLFAPNAKGQTPQGGGLASAVVPAVLPKSPLPIGSEDAVDQWIATSRQWNLRGLPLGTYTAFKVYYWTLDGKRTPKSYSIVDQEYDSWSDFEKKISDVGEIALKSLRSNPKVDTSHLLEASVAYGYEDLTDSSGQSDVNSVYMKKSLGLLSELTKDSFVGNWTFTVRRVVIRIDNLEEFEVVSKIPSRRLFWKTGDPIKYNPGQIEEIRPGVVILDGNHYASPDASVSFRIKARGEERIYNDTPTLRMINSSFLEINLIGLRTIVESSFDLEHWAPFREFQVDEGGMKIVQTYPPPNSLQQMFFRLSFIR